MRVTSADFESAAYASSATLALRGDAERDTQRKRLRQAPCGAAKMSPDAKFVRSHLTPIGERW